MRISDWSSDVCSSDLDIYFPNFVEWTQAYAVLGAPWFIPEANQAGAAEAPANALYAIGAPGAFGHSPFSIDHTAPGDAAGLADCYPMLPNLPPPHLRAPGRDRPAGGPAPAPSVRTPHHTQHG